MPQISRRILMLNYEFPPLGGGSSPVTLEIARGYAARGHSVDVITMGFKELPSREEKDGITIYRIPCLRARREICQPWELATFIVNAKVFLKEHLREHIYDINHTHFLVPSGLISRWLKRRYGLPYMVTVHGSDVPGYNPDRFTFLHHFTGPTLRRICREADHIVSPSRYLLTLLESRLPGFGDKSLVIPNGIHTARFRPGAKAKIILSTGRLLPRKGFQHLIRSVSDRDCGWEVHICGDGPMMPELRKLAAGSRTPVVLHGWLDNTSRQYVELLETASIYVLASERENASVSLLEAMAAGCATVAADGSGCSETVGDGGFLFEPRNVEQLGEVIRRLAGDPLLTERMGILARRRAETLYDWERIIDRYAELMPQR